MNDQREVGLANAYDRARPRLVRVAYAVLGTYAEAEDVVSDCWLRMVEADRHNAIEDVDAWATVAVARAALDTLRSARRRRERYVGPWLPEPLVGAHAGSSGPDPADRVTLDDTISYALLVVLETLTPAERTAWVLHDLFGVAFADVAAAVGRTPAAVRQLAVRARAHVNDRAPRVTVDGAEHATAVRGFLDAAVGGDLGALIEALDPDVVLTSDGGGQVTAARRPIRGADKVARFLRGAVSLIGADERVQLVDVNGAPGLGILAGDEFTTVIAITVGCGRVTRVDLVRAPSKLRAATRRLDP